MAEQFHFQSNFTLGELDEKLFARVDFQGYYKGAKKLKNTIISPQGGIKRSFGLGYTANINQPSIDRIKIKMFELEDSDIYAMVFVPDNILIYLEATGALVATVISTGYTIAQIKDLTFSQSSDTLVIIHVDVAPKKLVRTSAHGGWTLSTIAFKFLPVYDFDQNYDALGFTPGATTGTGITLTITLGVGIFTSAFIGGVFVGNGGTMRITGLTSTTVVTGDITTDFIDTAQIKGVSALLAEPAWSTARGWPGAVTFYQNRMVFGASKSLLSGVWLSKINDFRNFDATTALADGSLSDFIHNNTSNVVRYVTSSKSLIVFTSGGESATPILIEAPLTPDNFALYPQEANGIQQGVEPQILDNQVIFVEKGGKIVRNFVYDVRSGKYISTNISILSSHLIKIPVDSAVFKNSSKEDGSYYIVVNSDGSMSVYQTNIDEGVSAWTTRETAGAGGLFKQVSGVKDKVFAVVQRTIGAATKFYLEKIDFDAYMDSSITFTSGSPTTTITGLAHLEGQTVGVVKQYSNGSLSVLSDAVVSGGQITSSSPVESAQVGLRFNVEVIPMPLIVETKKGFDLYNPKHIKAVFVDYFESLGIKVKGQLLPNLQFGVSSYDTGRVKQTGFDQVTTMKDWKAREEISITQDDPLPLFIRGIGMEVDFND